MSAGWVFIDETGFEYQAGPPLWPLSVGPALYQATIPHGHWQSSTFIAALRHDSIQKAPFLIEGPVDAEVFSQPILSRCSVPQLHTWRHPHPRQPPPPTKSRSSASCFRLAGSASVLPAALQPGSSIPHWSWLSRQAQSAFAPGRRPFLGGSLFGPGKLPRLLLADPLPGGLSARPLCVYINRKYSNKRIGCNRK